MKAEARHFLSERVTECEPALTGKLYHFIEEGPKEMFSYYFV